MKSLPNKVLHLIAIPLRSIAAGELCRYPDRSRRTSLPPLRGKVRMGGVGAGFIPARPPGGLELSPTSGGINPPTSILPHKGGGSQNGYPFPLPEEGFQNGYPFPPCGPLLLAEGGGGRWASLSLRNPFPPCGQVDTDAKVLDLRSLYPSEIPPPLAGEG